MNEEYVWKDVGVVGFDELMQALERADRKGYMPDAVKEAWEGFNWKPAQQRQEPVAIALNTGTKQGVKWLKNVEHGEPLYTSPPASKPLTDEEIKSIEQGIWNPEFFDEVEIQANREFARAIEVAHGIKENT